MAGPRSGDLAWHSTDQYAQRIAYTQGGLPEYIGEAHPKNQHRTNFTCWRINKITYDVNDNAISILWADRSKDFRFNWTLRADYNYA